MANIIIVNYNLCCKIFGNLLFVELTQNHLTQLSSNNTQMQVVFAGDVDIVNGNMQSKAVVNVAIE